MYGYECPICGKTHQMNSDIGKRHYPDYLKQRDIDDKVAEEERRNKTEQTKEEIDKKLYHAIFGDKEVK